MRAPLVLPFVLCAACAVTTPRATTTAHDVAQTVPEQPVLRAYVQTLAAWMTPEERARLAALDYAGTDLGDAQRLRYLAADRIVRRLLPLALEARHEPLLDRYAAALRRLPPLLDVDTDAYAAPFVRLAMRGLRQSMAGVPVTDPVMREDAEARAEALGEDLEATLGASELVDDLLPPLDPQAEEEVAEALATYAEAYARRHGVSALEADAMAAAASDVVDSGLMHERAVEAWGLPREVVVEEAIALAGDMATAARRRERLPRPEREHVRPPIPPDAPGSPTRP